MPQREGRCATCVTAKLILALSLGLAVGLFRASGAQRITVDPLCTPDDAPTRPLAPGNPAPSTRRMAALLAQFRETMAPQGAAYLSDRAAGILEKQLSSATNSEQKMALEYQLGVQQTQAGWPDRALNTFSALEDLVQASGARLDARVASLLRQRKAVAYMRLGEQENCLANHNANSCLFPLKPDAFHLLPRGSRGAIALFEEQLATYPDDLSSRWLLNLAYMTLGEYPQKVPSKWVIPSAVFDSEYPMPQFQDVSKNLGLDVNTLAGGVIVDDFDNDGFYDIMVSAWDMDGQLRYYHNNGDGTFTERTSEAGLVGEVGSLNIIQTDYNNDGLLDVLLLRGGWLGKAGRMPSSLLRNNGDGTFTDVTEAAGLMSFHPTQSARWLDYDGDGWLDLFVAHESTDRKDPDWCELYHNNHDGTFTECAKACGIHVAEFVKGVACADYDNDGRPDLYLSTRSGPNILLHNEGPDASGQWQFSKVTASAGPLVEPHMNFGTFFFDYDNDGWEDLMVFGYFLPNGVGDVAADYLGLPNAGAKPRLFHNNRDGTFSDVTEATHLNRICHAMGHNFGDLDNDGWLDFYCGTGDPDFRTLIPNRMFRNAEGKFFQDVTTATGTGHVQKGHAVAFADLNDDGAQDVYIAMGGAYTGDRARNALFLNPGTTNHWVKLKLVGVRANRPGIGARLTINLQTPSGPRQLFRTVSSGGSFGSNPLRQEIGLGGATSIVSVDIRWPGSDTRQRVTGLELDRSYEIHEGERSAIAMKVHPVKFDQPTITLHAQKLQAQR